MAFTYEASPDQLAQQLTESVRGAIEDAIRRRLTEQARSIIDQVARQMAEAVFATVTSVHRRGPIGDELTVLLQINDGPREKVLPKPQEAPPAGGWAG